MTKVVPVQIRPSAPVRHSARCKEVHKPASYLAWRVFYCPTKCSQIQWYSHKSVSLIITSNQPFSQWDQIFPDTMMTVAAIDRIIHHATIIEIEEERYRKKTKHQKLSYFLTKNRTG